ELIISYKEIFRKQIPNALRYFGFSLLLTIVLAAIIGLSFLLMILNVLLGIAVGLLLFALFILIVPIFTFSVQYELAVSNRSLSASIRRSVDLGKKHLFLIAVYLLILMLIGFAYGLIAQVLIVFPLCVLLPLFYLVQFLVIMPLLQVFNLALWQKIKDQ
ncbi:hypothetical protein HY570_01950, partial [Candidatus Micrarchaeota archaeon]|nr:hypothetical protein [Candidatus Micrarchaeota archaeon]